MKKNYVRQKYTSQYVRKKLSTKLLEGADPSQNVFLLPHLYLPRYACNLFRIGSVHYIRGSGSKIVPIFFQFFPLKRWTAFRKISSYKNETHEYLLMM